MTVSTFPSIEPSSLLFVTPNFPPAIGGVQTYSAALARELSLRVRNFSVIAPLKRSARKEDRALPFRVVRVPELKDNFCFSATLPILALSRKHTYDTVFCTHWTAAYAAITARRAGGAKKIYCAVHGKELLLRPLSRVALAQSAYDKLRETVLERADGFFPVSTYTADLLREAGVEQSRIAVVNNGVDLKQYHPFDASDLRERLNLAGRSVLLTVARLVERKGVDIVLRALVELRKQVSNIAYVVVGDGPAERELQALSRRLGVDDCVWWVGRAKNEELAQYFNLSDIFVMPARSERPDVEGFGLVFLEASACARPVVGTHAGGIPDAVAHGKTGLLVKPNNVEEFSSAVLGLLRDPEWASRLGLNGYFHVKERTWAHAAQRIVARMYTDQRVLAHGQAFSESARPASGVFSSIAPHVQKFSTER